LLTCLLGGRDSSSHCVSEAVDYDILRLPNRNLAHVLAKNLEFDKLNLEFLQLDNARAGWLHVSFRSRENCGQCPTWHQNVYVRDLLALKNVPKKFQSAQKA